MTKPRGKTPGLFVIGLAVAAGDQLLFSDAQPADNQVPGWGNYFANKATAYGT
jgi:hypothetical protein